MIFQWEDNRYINNIKIYTQIDNDPNYFRKYAGIKIYVDDTLCGIWPKEDTGILIKYEEFVCPFKTAGTKLRIVQETTG